MDCTDSRSHLHPYLDGELDLERALALERHLAACNACREIFARQSALRAGIRELAAYHRAPARLAERIRSRIAARPPRMTRWLQLGAAAAAGAVLSWIAAIQYAAPPVDERIAEQVITGHSRSILTAHLVDVESSDRHTVKPWLSSRLDFSPPVVDLAGAGFPLAGGRLDYLDERPVAALVYHYRKHVIDLFVWPEAGRHGDSPMQAAARQGYHLLRWSEGGMTFWAISDVEAAELRTFAEAYAAAK
jgi:mycothiol system anti-sigma-R factor